MAFIVAWRVVGLDGLLWDQTVPEGSGLFAFHHVSALLNFSLGTNKNSPMKSLDEENIQEPITTFVHYPLFLFFLLEKKSISG